MFQYVEQMTLAEAESAYVRSIRNLSHDQVSDIQNNPGKLDDTSPLFRYARRLQRRIIELRSGVVYPEVADVLHHPV